MSEAAALLERVFFSEPTDDRSYRVETVEGEVPGFLRGTWYSNGPGRLARAGVRYRNWLDGDGVVVALRFDDDGAELRSRPIRTTKLREEEEAGVPLFRTFGTSFPGDRLNRLGVGLESPVNVSVYRGAGRLLAFGEQGLPWEIDPVTLETRGRFDFGGRLNEASPFAGHPKIDPDSGELVNFGVSYSPRSPCIHLYRFDRKGELARRSRLPLEAPFSIHDFTLAGRHAVFYASPYVLDAEAVLTGGKTVMEALNWEPGRGSRIVVASLDTGEEVARIDVGSGDAKRAGRGNAGGARNATGTRDAGGTRDAVGGRDAAGARYCLHLVNGFESGGRLVVDVIELERPVYDQYQVLPEVFVEAREACPVRYVIDPSGRAPVERTTLPYRKMCDFPSVDPSARGRPYEDSWMLGISASDSRGCKLFDELVHARWPTPGSDPLPDSGSSRGSGQVDDLYRAPAGRFLGSEPVFVADPGDDGGAVLCQELDARSGTSWFLVFDAFDVRRGPLARLRLEGVVRLGFHATFDREAP